MDSFTKYVIDVLGYVPDGLECFEPGSAPVFSMEGMAIESLNELKRWASFLEESLNAPIK